MLVEAELPSARSVIGPESDTHDITHDATHTHTYVTPASPSDSSFHFDIPLVPLALSHTPTTHTRTETARDARELEYIS